MTVTSHRLRLMALVSMGVLAVVGIVSAETASNTVSPSRLGQVDRATGPNDLKPLTCGGITVTNLIVGTGETVNGTAASDLLVGTRATRTINGFEGNDCIVGNADVSHVDGGSGTDVCIGSVETEFERCEVIVRQ